MYDWSNKLLGNCEHVWMSRMLVKTLNLCVLYSKENINSLLPQNVSMNNRTNDWTYIQSLSQSRIEDSNSTIGVPTRAPVSPFVSHGCVLVVLVIWISQRTVPFLALLIRFDCLIKMLLVNSRVMFCLLRLDLVVQYTCSIFYFTALEIINECMYGVDWECEPENTIPSVVEKENYTDYGKNVILLYHS